MRNWEQLTGYAQLVNNIFARKVIRETVADNASTYDPPWSRQFSSLARNLTAQLRVDTDILNTVS